VWLGAMKIMITQVYRPRGVTLQGVGFAPNGTHIQQFADFDGDAIVTDPGLPSTEFDHWGGINSLRLSKQGGWTPGTKTGNGINITRPAGENLHNHDLLIRDFPNSGLCYSQGGTPAFGIHDIHGFNNGDYLISVPKPSNRQMQVLKIWNVSADNNGKGVIYLSRFGNRSENIALSNIKAESTSTGKHPCIVHLDWINNIGVKIDQIGGFTNATTQNSGLLEAIVKLTGSFQGARLYYNGYIPGYPYAIKDTTTSAAPVPQPERGETISYQTSGVVIERW
jgi:hypothetical protein